MATGRFGGRNHAHKRFYVWFVKKGVVGLDLECTPGHLLLCSGLQHSTIGANMPLCS